MKEATGEVSMTVVTIVLVAVILGIAMLLFAGNESPGRQWINNTFDRITGAGDAAMDNAESGIPTNP